MAAKADIEPIYLLCYRSRAQLPFTSGYMYICKPNCPLEVIRPSTYFHLYYCDYEKELFRRISIAYQRAAERYDVVELGTNRISMMLPNGGEDCLLENRGCRVGGYYVSFTFDKDAIYAFTTNIENFERTFHVATTRIPFSYSTRDVLSAMLSQSFSTVADDISTVLTVSAIQRGIRGNLGRLMKATAYIGDAISQIVTSCSSKDTAWLSRWLRFAACGSYVPLFFAVQWANALRRCRERQDWDCVFDVELNISETVNEMRR